MDLRHQEPVTTDTNFQYNLSKGEFKMFDPSIQSNFSASPMSYVGTGSHTMVSNQDMANALGNAYGTAIVDAVNNMISERSDIPQAKKEEIGDMLDAALDRGKLDTSNEAKDFIELIMDFIKEVATEEIKEADKSASGEGSASSAGGGGGGNWLVALAKAMGKVAGQHLANTVALGKQISALEGQGEAAAALMPELTAQMQAESQMFKMAQETVTTVVKTVGEALHSTARKQ